MNKPHPIPTFIDRHGRVCDEFGPINPHEDSFSLIISDIPHTFKPSAEQKRAFIENNKAAEKANPTDLSYKTLKSWVKELFTSES